MNENEILEFIHRRFPKDSNWTNGNCYWFAVILKERFDCAIMYDVINGHFLCEIPSENWSEEKPLWEHYDWTGRIYPNEENLVPWDFFDRYDSAQKKRIEENCIL